MVQNLVFLIAVGEAEFGFLLLTFVSPFLQAGDNKCLIKHNGHLTFNSNVLYLFYCTTYRGVEYNFFPELGNSYSKRSLLSRVHIFWKIFT